MGFVNLRYSIPLPFVWGLNKRRAVRVFYYGPFTNYADISLTDIFKPAPIMLPGKGAKFDTLLRYLDPPFDVASWGGLLRITEYHALQDIFVFGASP